MQFPLSLWDISLWLAITAIILLIASEMLSSSRSKTNIFINKKKLRNVAFVFAILFIITVAIRVLTIILIS
jgi:hypothetical protein